MGKERNEVYVPGEGGVITPLLQVFGGQGEQSKYPVSIWSIQGP